MREEIDRTKYINMTIAGSRMAWTGYVWRMLRKDRKRSTIRWKRLPSAEGELDVMIENPCEARYLTGKLPS